MELMLLRHGATLWNLQHRYLGRTDQPLTPEGEKQAANLCGKLPAPELLFVSPLRRCTRTAELIWPHVPQIPIPDLRETDFGTFEGKTWAELKDFTAYRLWIDGKGECPGGEDSAEVTRRVLRAADTCICQALVQNCTRVALVAHGGTTMTLLHAHLGGDFYHWQPPLCGLWRVEIAPDGRFLQAEKWNFTEQTD